MRPPSYGNAVLGIARAINDEIAEILQEEKGMDQMREELAALMHEIQEDWMKYLLRTPYDELSEKEKDSDRKEADKVLALIEKCVWEHAPGKLVDLPLFQSYQADR